MAAHRRTAGHPRGRTREHPARRRRGKQLVSVYVRLRLGAEAYAIPVEHVREVGELGEVQAVPGSGPEMLGLRNLRGQILPIVDLALLLGIDAVTRPARLLVAEAGGRPAGVAILAGRAVGGLPGPARVVWLF